MGDCVAEAKKILQFLFEKAREKGSIEYIYTLLRVTGITREKDPLIRIKDTIKEIDESKNDDIAFVNKFKLILQSDDIFAIILNLVNCTNGKPYGLNPFSSLNQGQFPHLIRPNLKQRIDYTLQQCKDLKQEAIEKILREVFDNELLEVLVKESPSSSEIQVLKDSFPRIKEFINNLIELQHLARLEFLKQPRFYKLPRFEVLELLTSADDGLYGFHMHFSNGTSAKFVRGVDGTDCINVIPERTIGFQVGLLEELKDEWRIGDKRLYEVGLPGRYNKLGEWKPLIYPGDSDPLQREAASLSKDSRIQGCLFYMMCTGHRVLEFVICSTLNLPIEHATLGDKLHLWKCPPLDKEKQLYGDIHIYDGWINLDSPTVEDIKAAIDSISIAANRIAFIYGASVKWCVKYDTVYSGGGCPSPTEQDLEILNDSLKKFPVNEDAMVLDSAIDWFNHGKNSTNIFTRFLCYYIAMESITIAITDGTADFELGYIKKTKGEIRDAKRKCIEGKYKSLYVKDPIRFIREAYFDCHESLKSKTSQIVSLVFGDNHEYIKKLFTKEKGWSLSDIRGALAHGKLSHLDDNHREIVRERMYDIELIVKDFIQRLIFRLRPKDKIPSWSGKHALTCSTADPRMTLVVSKEKFISNKDWRVRPEWCE